MTPRLSISLLGPFQATLDGEAITGFESNKVRGLLAYLAVEAHRAHSRDALAGLLWPEQPDANALSNLRFALSNLRHATGDRRAAPSFLLITRQAIQLNPAGNCQVDVAAFAGALAACDHHLRDGPLVEAPVVPLQRAADLYGGSFLEGFYVVGAPAFDEWLTLRREQFEQQALDVLDRLADCRERRGEYGEAERCARRQLALDPWREEAHRRLMRALARTGRRNGALAQYERCRRVLAGEVGVDPAPETDALCARIRAAAETRPHNLPPLGDRSFVGRAEELGLVCQALADPRRRLVTLVGPGGIGKTRLALHVAWSAAADYLGPFLHGVYFVPLAVADEAGAPATALATAIAQAIALPFHGPAPPDRQLLNALHERECLLLVDNGECLGEAGRAQVAGLLRGADGVQFLVTSRERLGLGEEWVIEIDGLPFPAPRARRHAAPAANPGPELLAYDAIRLFVERARQADDAFSLEQKSGQERAAVARISQLARGMPLAIELAAPWVRALSCHEIARGIEESLDLLARAAPGGPARHASIRAAFEYSWRMLPPAERCALVRLSVFGGGFDRLAAAQVADAGLDVLAALRDKSLLQREGGGDGSRYAMHPLLRRFAAEKADGEQLRQARARHAGYYGRFLDERRGHLEGARLAEVLREIEVEVENVRAGWAWAVAERRIDLVGQYADGLYTFYATRGWLHEGREAFGPAVARLTELVAPGTDQEHTLTFAGLLIGLSDFCYCLGDVERTEALLQEARALCHRVEEPQKLALAYEQLGFVASRRGDYERASDLFEFGLRIALDGGCETLVPHLFLAQGALARDRGDPIRAHEHFRRGLDRYRALGHPWGTAHALRLLADTICEMGEHELARRHYRRSMSLFRSVDDVIGQALGWNGLGRVAQGERRYEEAEENYQRAADLAQEAGDAKGTALAFERLAHLTTEMGRNDEAKAYFRASFEWAARVQDVPLVLRVLVGIARLIVQNVEDERDLARAAELLHAVRQHQAATAGLEAEAEAMIEQLAPRSAFPTPSAYDGTFRALAVLVSDALAG